MKALVVGGTKGFGKEISEELSGKGYDIITVSRSKVNHAYSAHYSCDVGDLDSWVETMKKTKSEHPVLDLLVCVVGFAEPKPSKELTANDWNLTLSRNVTYVALALQELSDILALSEDPRVITIGSQWSYKIGCDEFVPYTVSKHALRTLTEDFASRNPEIKANHYCPATMDTPGYRVVRGAFEEMKGRPTIYKFNPDHLANPGVIAKSLIGKALQESGSGNTFRINPTGSVERL